LRLKTARSGDHRRAFSCNNKLCRADFVKTRDTITEWKVIPPYPKDFTKFVKKINKHLFEPHTLYFVKTDAVKCLQME
jgi:hypothetical protein